MRLLAALCVLPMILAGCGDDPGPAAPPDDPFDDLDDEPVPEGKGLIRGVVIDPTITPVVGAKVELLNHDMEATTTESGAFVFNGLEPGSYIVRASKPGYSTIQSSATVEANVAQPPVVKVQLERMPGTEPRAVTTFQDGYIVCSIGEPTNDHSCDTSGDQKTDVVFDFEGVPHWVQTEIAWDSTQPAGSNLYVIQGVCGCSGLPSFSQRFDETGGAVSVHVARAGPAFLAEVGAGNASKQVYVDVSASGPALGTGLALDQRFSVYLTVFYNIEPVEGWTFVADGEYPAGS